MHTVALSRRNLLTLLSKLDRVKAGENSACTIIKRRVTHKKYPQSMDAVIITAVEDDEYYTGNDSIPGEVLHADDPDNK